MRFSRQWTLAGWLVASLAVLACDDGSKNASGDTGLGGPSGRIQGRVQLTDGTGLGGVGVSAAGLRTRTDELGIFVLDAPVGPSVTLSVESDHYTNPQRAVEVIENSTVSAALDVVPLRRLALDDVEQDSTAKGEDGFSIEVPARSLQTKDGKPVTGKAEVRYAVLDDSKKMRAAPGELSTLESGQKKPLEAFGLVEVRFYKDNTRLSYNGPSTELKVPMDKANPPKEGEAVASYHYDAKEDTYQRKVDGVIKDGVAVLNADEFSTWCAARGVEAISCVTGRVVDAMQRPTPLANVELAASSRLALARTLSGNDGRFCLESIAGAPHVLRVLSALDVFRGREQTLATHAQAASCGSDACFDLGDVALEELLFEAATTTAAEGDAMDASTGGDPDGGASTADSGTLGSDASRSEGGIDSDGAIDSGIATPVVCGTPIWLDDPSTCSPDLVEDGGTTNFVFDGQACAALWVCASDFNRITLQLAHDTCMRTSIYGASASGPLVSSGNRCGTTLLDDISLPGGGPHLVLLEASGGATELSGNYGITMWSVGNDPAQTVALDGTAGQIDITDPGQNGSFSFQASAGARIALTIESSVVTDYSMRSPTGISSTLGASSTFFSDSFTVSESGTYTVLVDPRNDGLSSYSFQVFSVAPDAEVATTIDAVESPSFEVLKPGQNGSFTFPASANQRIAFSLTGPNVVDVSLGRITGTGNLDSWAGSNIFSDVVTLPEAGTYRIRVDPRVQGVGTYTLTLWSVPADHVLSTTVDAPAVALSLATPGQNGRVNFVGSALQRVAFRATAASVTDYVLRPPLGSQNVGTWASGGTLFSDVLTLPQDGTYSLNVDPRNQGIDASLSVQLFSVPADPVIALTLGGAASQFTVVGVGQNAEFTLNVGSAPATVTFQLGVSGGVVDYQVLSPQGVVLASGAISSSATVSNLLLSLPGVYRVVMNPRGEALPTLTVSASGG